MIFYANRNLSLHLGILLLFNTYGQPSLSMVECEKIDPPLLVQLSML